MDTDDWVIPSSIGRMFLCGTVRRKAVVASGTLLSSLVKELRANSGLVHTVKCTFPGLSRGCDIEAKSSHPIERGIDKVVGRRVIGRYSPEVERETDRKRTTVKVSCSWGRHPPREV